MVAVLVLHIVTSESGWGGAGVSQVKCHVHVGVVEALVFDGEYLSAGWGCGEYGSEYSERP